MDEKDEGIMNEALNRRKKSIKRRLFAAVMSICMISVPAAVLQMTAADEAQASSSEVHGMWIAFCDFSSLGLYDKAETSFTENLDRALNKAKYYGTNTIYFHVRAFDDAAWKSKTFKASKYLTPAASSRKTAFSTYNTLGYDPLAIVIREAHERGLKIEAYMNPYRITYSKFLDPKSPYSTSRINKAVDELQAYDLDGIHFDDYFYHSTNKYISPYASTYDKIDPAGVSTESRPSESKRRTYVNAMVRSVYSNVHRSSDWSIAGTRKFGISPAGNVGNALAGGASVKTWLSHTGYVDYVAPQLYWTDNWGHRGKTKMYTVTLEQWTDLHTNKDVSLYIGLASYKAGVYSYYDRGWGWRNTNLRTQVKKLRAEGCSGYILFEARDLYRTKAKTELYKLKGLVKPIYASSISFVYPNKTGYTGKAVTAKLRWYPADSNPKSVVYTSANRKIATVSSRGRVTGRIPGKTTITAKTRNGKIAKCTVTVKTCTVKVTSRYVVSRRGPGSSYAALTKYRKGTRLRIAASSGHWGRIKHTHKWVYMPHTKRI